MRTLSSYRRWFVMALLSAGFGLLGAAVLYAQEVTPPPEPPRDCAECHLDVVSKWQQSPHAQAYHDPAFQTAWQEHDQETTCFACHTTGYVARTGLYEQEGVACASCHGDTPGNHPPEAVLVDPGVQVCAGCHATTYAEWQVSAHGEQQLACTTCHTPHNQRLRFDVSTALCLNCHAEERSDYAHLSHPEQACVDCHWYRSFDKSVHITSGNLLTTGHDSVVETRTCVDCHANLAENEQAANPVVSAPTLVEQLQIDELESEVQTVRAQSENQAAVHLIQGMLVGVVLSGLGIGGFVSLRRHKNGG